MAISDEVWIESRAAWRRWLVKNHARSHGVWVVHAKRAATAHYVSNEDIGEEALCFGWIDSLVGAVDDTHSKLLVTPRSPKSAWSRVNKARVARLERLGLMTAAGRKVIAAAKRDGRWSAIDAVEQLRVPQDLDQALRRAPSARANFDAFPRSAKRAILEWIAGAKRPETRARRVLETAEKAARGVRANQWRQPKSAMSRRGDLTRPETMIRFRARKGK